MPKFECRYKFGDLVSLFWGGTKVEATIRGVAFWADNEQPKYMLEEYDSKRRLWTEAYYDVFEKDIIGLATKGFGE